MIKRSMSWLRRISPVKLGVGFLVVAILSGIALFQKDRIVTTLTPGESIQADFARDYRLEPFHTKVKVAGVPVGVVTSVVRQPDGTAGVTLKVDDGIPEKIGALPAAVIRPNTLLGGNYSVELLPGGGPGRIKGTIPTQRTKTPVELDRVAAALQPPALQGLRSSVGNLDSTLRQNGQQQLKNLVRDAPATLGPAGDVVDAARGTQPNQDLPKLVSGLESTSRVLSEKQGQLDGTVRDLNTASATLGRQSEPIAETVHNLPQTLSTARVGLDRLSGSLSELQSTAGPARPAVRKLDAVLTRADPVLAKARPVVGDLRGVLHDAQPTVQELEPTVDQGTGVLNDVRGPVLDRIHGPVMQTVLSPYRGSGPYQGSGANRPLYQELAYMISNLDSTSKMTDRNGASVAFEPGVGPGTVGGLPINFEQLFDHLRSLQGGQR